MSATGDIMEADSERILELEIEIQTKDKRIAELEAKLDAVVGCKVVIDRSVNYAIRMLENSTQTPLIDKEINELRKALAAIEALQQPDSGEQG